MRVQTRFEERLNTLTHAFGAFLGSIGLLLLLIFDSHKNNWTTLSCLIYGSAIIFLFTISALYHAMTDDKIKHRFRVLDHIGIYILIAGTYTPVSLIALEHSLGWILFWIVWGIAICGIILKLFFTGRFEILSLVLYVAMGWLIVFDFNNLSAVIGGSGITLLIAGGLAYTLGIIFYAVEKIPYNHVIWHLFVLAGAICHFFMIFFYVI